MLPSKTAAIALLDKAMSSSSHRRWPLALQKTRVRAPRRPSTSSPTPTAPPISPPRMSFLRLLCPSLLPLAPLFIWSLICQALNTATCPNHHLDPPFKIFSTLLPRDIGTRTMSLCLPSLEALQVLPLAVKIRTIEAGHQGKFSHSSTTRTRGSL